MAYRVSTRRFASGRMRDTVQTDRTRERQPGGDVLLSYGTFEVLSQ